MTAERRRCAVGDGIDEDDQIGLDAVGGEDLRHGGSGAAAVDLELEARLGEGGTDRSAGCERGRRAARGMDGKKPPRKPKGPAKGTHGKTGS
jgi:hypothetical protein